MNKNSLPLVTVITPFYNDNEYFPSTLESYFAQTYRNLEMIIIDNNSMIQPEAFVPENPKYPIRVIHLDKNYGPAAARNRGIKSAKDELIAFLDADDIWMPEIVEKEVSVFLNNPDAVWVYTDGYYIVNGRRMRKPNSMYHGFRKGLPKGWGVNEYHLRGVAFEMMPANMMRRRVIEEVGFFNENLPISEDWDLFCKIAEKYPVHCINEPLVLYRRKTMGFHYINLDSYVEVHTSILKGLYENQRLLPSKQRDFNKSIAVTYERVGIQLLNKKEPAKAQQYFMHPATKPLQFTPRFMVLRLLSLLPPIFYRIALKIYDIIL